jgi:hypothetical protein
VAERPCCRLDLGLRVARLDVEDEIEPRGLGQASSRLRTGNPVSTVASPCP